MTYSNKLFYRTTVTGAVALAGALAADGVILVEMVKLHLSGAGAAENFTVEIDSGVNVVYDCILHSQSTNAITDYTWIPANPVVVDDGDAIDFNLTNTNAVTVGLEVVYRREV